MVQKILELEGTAKRSDPASRQKKSIAIPTLHMRDFSSRDTK
jgi:hypothetical protein